MEKEVKKDKGIKIKLCVIITGVFLILIGGYFTYKYLTSNNIASKFKLATIEKTNEFGTKTKVLTINGKETKAHYLSDKGKYEILGYIDDMIVISVNYYILGSDYIYVFDTDGNEIKFGNDKESLEVYPVSDAAYPVKDNYTSKVSIKKNEIIMKYVVNKNNKESILCNLVEDDEIYEETDKVVYKDGKFSNKEVVSKTTNIQYREKNNIKCSNSIKISMGEQANNNYRYININDKPIDLVTYGYRLIGRIEDRIVILNEDFLSNFFVYAIDKDGNYQKFGNDLIEEAKVENNSILITSRSNYDIEESICSSTAKDDDPFETIEKITYKDGKFNSSKTVLRTVKDAYIDWNIDCSNYSKNDNSNKEIEEKQTNLKELDVNSDVYKSVEKTYNKLHYYGTDIAYKTDYFWTTDKLLNSEMTYEQKMTILINAILDESGECTYGCLESGFTISKTDFSKRYHQLFGEDIGFTDLEVTPASCPSCAPIASAKFEGSKVRLFRDGIRGLFSDYATPIINVAKQNDDEVYFYEKLSFIRYDVSDGKYNVKLYSDIDFKQFVTEYTVEKYEDIFNKEFIEPVKDKLDTFKYTFKANGDGTYHFVEVEKMR